MISDIQTNLVCFSDLLPRRFPAFFKRMQALLEQTGIKYQLLSETKDIWCRDYMPIQVNEHHFVQFKYDPSYLKLSSDDEETITEPRSPCQGIGISAEVSDLRVDGGNIVRKDFNVIMTERVCSENPSWRVQDIINEIKNRLKVKRITLIPECPGDLFGHADGIVRFIEGPGVDPRIVFVTDLSAYLPKYFTKLMMALMREGYLPVLLPYNDTCALNDLDATGLYINFMQVGGKVIYPTFGLKEDVLAASKFKRYFGNNAYPLRSNEIAQQGGVLNCISWNIRR